MSAAIDALRAALADRYELVRELGRGGMATVYLARDVRHEREVAIKVLHPDLGAVLGGERFLAEIKTTAKLQHPHILPLLDSGAAEGLLYYVMPFVEGETLRARLEREQLLPIADALRLAREVANALDYAHRQGVIHRDIKPENILLHDGSALVADFGIALAVQQAGGARMTQTGLSLGTPQYMSPEQAMGEKTIDARSDIYALGVVTYEMLTGEPPFSGATVQSIVARVLTEKPVAPSVLRDTVPPHVDAAVLTALAKRPPDRPATARVFADALTGSVAMPTARSAEPTAPSRGARVTRVWIGLSWLITAAALVYVVVRAPSSKSEKSAASPVVRVPMPLGPTERIKPSGGALAISPGGDALAYQVEDEKGVRILLRRTADLTAHVIVDHEVRNLVFSRDGRLLYYQDDLKLLRVSVDGGDAQLVTTLSTGQVYYRGSWISNDTLLVGSPNGAYAIAVESGSIRPATPRFAVRYPVVLPDGRTVVFGLGVASPTGTLAALDLGGGPVRNLSYGHVVPLAVIDTVLLVMDVDAKTLRALPANAAALARGDQGFVVADSVIGDPVIGVQASVSRNGSLLILRGALLSQVIVRNANGKEEALPLPPETYDRPRLSPDGATLLLHAGRPTQLLRFDRRSRALTPLGDTYVGDWTGDGRRVVFMRSDRKALLWRPADGTGTVDTLLAESYPDANLSPDGSWILYRTGTARNDPNDIFGVRREGPRTPVRLASGPSVEYSGSVSADGRWMTYISNSSGRFEVYLRPFPQEGTLIKVSQSGGVAPFWSRRGHTLYYQTEGRLVAADIAADGALSPTRRTIIDFAAIGASSSDIQSHQVDISADEREVIFTRRVPGAERLVFVHNWIRELRERVQGGGR